MSGHPARYTDGRSARAREVSLDLEAGDLVIVDAGAVVDRWPAGDVRGLPDSARGELILRPYDGEARLLLTRSDAVEWAKAALPELGGRVHNPLGWRRIAIWAGGAAVALVVMVAVVIPGLANRLAERIPPEREIALGQSLRGDLARLLANGRGEDPMCTTPEGTAALTALSDRLLGEAELPYPVEVGVVDSTRINALALPGGQVLLLRGLIEAADGPDAVAGVLAHEIGHVAARDPTRLALRAAGSAGILGLVVGDVLGGAAMVAAANALLDASFSREAEAAADAYALDMLRMAEIAPEGFAAFFDLLAERQGDGPDELAWFRSHPDTVERGARAAAVTWPGRPALSAQDWAALQAICD